VIGHRSECFIFVHDAKACGSMLQRTSLSYAGINLELRNY